MAKEHKGQTKQSEIKQIGTKDNEKNENQH